MAEDEHEHEWGPWLISPYFDTRHMVRRCECGEEDKQKVAMLIIPEEIVKFMEESKPILFTILVDVATTLSAKLTKNQIIYLMRETVDELERR